MLQESEVTPVRTSGRERVMGRDDDVTPLRGVDRIAKLIEDLRLGVRGAIGRGVAGLVALPQPPLRVQKDETNPLTHVAYLRAWTSTSWQELDEPLTHRFDELCQTPHRVPPIRA